MALTCIMMFCLICAPLTPSLFVACLLITAILGSSEYATSLQALTLPDMLFPIHKIGLPHLLFVLITSCHL